MTSHREIMENVLNICTDRGDGFRIVGESSPRIRLELDKLQQELSPTDLNPDVSVVLQQRLERIEQTTDIPSEMIYPRVALQKVFTVELVQKLLPSHGTGVTETARRICSSFCVILGILVSIEHAADIQRFLDAGIDDKALPITVGRTANDVHSVKERISVDSWTRNTWLKFAKYQWSFLTPFFSRPGGMIHHYILKCPGHMIGIINRETNESWDGDTGGSPSQYTSGSDSGAQMVIPFTAGGQGSVKKVQLDPLSHDFGDYPFKNEHGWYALKELHPIANRDVAKLAFTKEAYMWNRVCNYMKEQRKPQAVPLLCTYEVEIERLTRYYFVSPWASGNLRGLWHTNKDGGDDTNFTPKWMIRQCYDMATFLAGLHANAKEFSAKFATEATEEPIFVRHGDIKPENILWFKDYEGCVGGGALLLGDFGISKAHRKNTKSFSIPKETQHSETCAAPEFKLRDSDKTAHRIGRRADIWSLGCTWVSFATWLVMGSEGLKNFDRERDEVDPDRANFNTDHFFTLLDGGKRAEVKPAVRDWIENLGSHERCSSSTRKFLEVVKEKMLVVDVDKRATALEVSESLEGLQRGH